MDNNNFEFIRQFIKAETAIVLEPTKEYLVECRLTPISKELGFASLDELIHAFKRQPREEIKLKIIDAMTINETLFFRDIHPFELLKTKIFPELKAKKSNKKVDIWCAAASSGQEPYTIAMILKELSSQFQGWSINIIASDISEKMLAKAKEGLYNQMEVNRGLPLTYLTQFFEKKGPNWQINKEIRDMVTFQKINLINPWAIPKMDLVFMRNVLIYFNIDTKKEIVKRVEATLNPEGYLFLGGAETTIWINNQFVRVGIDKFPCYQLKQNI
ncbi:CheR family methyltransferase [Legionella rowbothamii]|uniref:CheR family methyltransferase n=1 Tax=Legionella rowbothamii TaxID=96229 RepID=UPI0010547FE5|nr:protein-glutamate O-methyltransferase CheR [Legionella rowbothamii]